jgi:copper(I)-binding protein
MSGPAVAGHKREIAAMLRAFVVSLLLFAGSGIADAVRADDPPPPAATPAITPPITIENAWSRAAPQGRSTAVYLTIKAAAGEADQLSGVRADLADRAELHQSREENGVARMRPVASIPIEPGTSVTLAPGGYHVMLTGLHRALAVGETFSLTCTFERAGEVVVTVHVERAGASTPAGQGAHDHMPGMEMGGHKMP